jgi:hypothetical protein
MVTDGASTYAAALAAVGMMFIFALFPTAGITP